MLPPDGSEPDISNAQRGPGKFGLQPDQRIPAGSTAVIEEVRFGDSPLEGDGFELPVPRGNMRDDAEVRAMDIAQAYSAITEPPR
jgi:hypothetical protein